LLHATVLAPRILRWLLDFWKRFAPVSYIILLPLLHVLPMYVITALLLSHRESLFTLSSCAG